MKKRTTYNSHIKCKRITATILTFVLLCCSVLPVWAETDQVSQTAEPTLIFEKIGEDAENIYFRAEIMVHVTSSNSTRAEVPVLTYFNTAVNKTQGKIGITITITGAGLYLTANCSGITVSGDMGGASHYALSASNLYPKSAIYINDMFSGLKKNVATGSAVVTVAGGTFTGPNLNGTYVGGVGVIDLSQC